MGVKAWLAATDDMPLFAEWFGRASGRRKDLVLRVRRNALRLQPMSVVSIIATFECDECGSRFTASLDESYEPPAGWSVFDVAEDAIRGGTWETVENGKQLCRACTKKADIAAESSGDTRP